MKTKIFLTSCVGILIGLNLPVPAVATTYYKYDNSAATNKWTHSASNASSAPAWGASASWSGASSAGPVMNSDIDTSCSGGVTFNAYWQRAYFNMEYACGIGDTNNTRSYWSWVTNSTNGTTKKVSNAYTYAGGNIFDSTASTGIDGALTSLLISSICKDMSYSTQSAQCGPNTTTTTTAWAGPAASSGSYYGASTSAAIKNKASYLNSAAVLPSLASGSTDTGKCNIPCWMSVAYWRCAIIDPDLTDTTGGVDDATSGSIVGFFDLNATSKQRIAGVIQSADSSACSGTAVTASTISASSTATTPARNLFITTVGGSQGYTGTSFAICLGNSAAADSAVNSASVNLQSTKRYHLACVPGTFTANATIVTYDGNNGMWAASGTGSSALSSDITMYPGQTLSVPSSAPTRDGWTFKGYTMQ